MNKLAIRPQARQDIKQIWHYSYERWGEAQAESYLERIHQGMEKLASNPMLGKSRDNLRAGYRSFRVGQHLIYYTVSGDTLSIRRVRHERMDPDF
jgi:toxin ParE1/3/4